MISPQVTAARSDYCWQYVTSQIMFVLIETCLVSFPGARKKKMENDFCQAPGNEARTCFVMATYKQPGNEASYKYELGGCNQSLLRHPEARVRPETSASCTTKSVVTTGY